MTSRLSVAAHLALLFACASCAKVMGTETGNPPAIATTLIGVEAIDDDHVRVSGEAGSITPGGGEVEVTNKSRDEDPIVVQVEQDGSFSAELPGTPDDEYEVVAIGEDGSSPPRSVGGAPMPMPDWHTLHACDDADPSDPVTVTALRIEGDVLQVDVSHAGGCAQHEYGLCWEDAWAASNPIQVGFRVLHDDGGDSCEALLSEELAFELTPFQDAYAELFGGDDTGAASLGFGACEMDGEPVGSCQVLYEWGDPNAACGPPIRAACPPFPLPDAPDAWVTYPTRCQFSFRGPQDLIDLDPEGIDSCVDELESDTCTFSAGSGGFSGELVEFEESGEEYEVGQATIDGYTAKVVTARMPGQERPWVAGAHFPDPAFAPEPDTFGISADFIIFCTTREQRDAMLPALGTVRFD